jgi:ATP-binding cassette subfamily B protein
MSEDKNVRPTRGRGPMGGGPMGGMIGGEKAKDFKGSVSKLAKYIGKYKIRIILVVIFAIGSTIFSIVGPKILGQVTTKLFKGLGEKLAGTGGIDFDSIGKTLLLLLGLYGISTLFSLIQGFIMTGISQ